MDANAKKLPILFSSPSNMILKRKYIHRYPIMAIIFFHSFPVLKPGTYPKKLFASGRISEPHSGQTLSFSFISVPHFLHFILFPPG